jgi:hypothetical protein
MESSSLEYCCIVVFLNGICEDKYPDINLCSAHPPVVITRDKKLRKRGNLARADSHKQLISNAGSQNWIFSKEINANRLF